MCARAGDQCRRAQLRATNSAKKVNDDDDDGGGEERAPLTTRTPIVMIMMRMRNIISLQRVALTKRIESRAPSAGSRARVVSCVYYASDDDDDDDETSHVEWLTQ